MNRDLQSGSVAREAGEPRTLAERAYRFLADRGGPASVSDLIRSVFGTKFVGPWQPILDAVLRADTRFERCAEGWRLQTPDRPESSGTQIVGVAIATTGASARRHRVVRLSAVRVEDGRTTGRFDAEINPRRRLPAYVMEAARLNQELVDEAPCFAEVVEAFRELLGDAPLAAYGVRWVLDFLAAELVRAELPGLPNRSVEIDDLARCVLVSSRKPSLQAVAEHIGVSHPRPGYPPADAEISARVAAELLDRQRAGQRLGLEWLGPEPGERFARHERPWLVDAPNGPGVYVVEAGDGSALYVGKAANLRRRLRTYASRSFGLNRQLEGLAVRAARVVTTSTASDLEARLLEAQLIRRHRPPFNVQRRARARRAVIRAAPGDSSPRASLVAEPKPDGALYIGPFRSERVARQALALARAVYPLACLRGSEQVSARRHEVQAAVRLLSGQKSEALTELRASMRSASASGDQAAVDRARNLIRAVLDFELRPSPLLGISIAEPLLVVDPATSDAAARAHLIVSGFLRGSLDVPSTFDPTSQTDLATLVAELRADERQPNDLEDAAIVQRWLAELGPRHVVIRLARDTFDPALVVTCHFDDRSRTR